jgi:hypothetical protein
MKARTAASLEVKQKVIGDLLKTAAGRHKLAASMVQPLRFRRDYTSIGRKTFLVEQLPDGALPVYDKDPRATAYIIGEEGENILAIQKPKRVIFPLFEIASNPEIPLTQIKERRFDLIERSQDLAKAEIQAEEDGRVFEIMDAIAGSATDDDLTNGDIAVVAPVTSDVLADAFADVERHDLRVARIYSNARDYADVRKWGRDILDIETQAVLLKTGLLAHLWGAQILVSRRVPVGFQYVCCEPEMFGRIPVRTEVTVLSADDPKSRTIGFSIFENIGIGAHNPAGLSRLVISR